jgi:YfiH family protein
MHPHPEYPTLLQFDLLSSEPGIEHFFTTRSGGVSKGNFHRLIWEIIPMTIRWPFRESDHSGSNVVHETFRFIVPHQTHGSRILAIDEHFLSLSLSQKNEILYGVDATVTQLKNFFLCVTVADCVPILLYDRTKGVVAAVHAGWRGTSDRIVEKTIRFMQEQYSSSASDIVAAIGPAICMQHYEVGDEVVEIFRQRGFDLSSASIKNEITGKMHIDLKEINRLELLCMGILPQHIEKTDLCTYENPDLFFSARRQSVHCGRMLCGIMLK